MQNKVCPTQLVRQVHLRMNKWSRPVPSAACLAAAASAWDVGKPRCSTSPEHVNFDVLLLSYEKTYHVRIDQNGLKSTAALYNMAPAAMYICDCGIASNTGRASELLAHAEWFESNGVPEKKFCAPKERGGTPRCIPM